ncbi:MAG: tetratricopeptide repeat protein [Planctomycetia bacterium]|nr:tetratricopeptide repeat protein [Planctomycetia bacterium]
MKTQRKNERRQPEPRPTTRRGRNARTGADGLARAALWGSALVALALAAYWPALENGFIWDDEHYVTENPTLRTLWGLKRMWFEPRSLPQYYPLVHTTFWIEHHLWGDAPLGYHLVNIVLHGTSAILLWRLLSRLGVPGAWLAAAIFAVHPVHVESVAWATERKNVLAGVLALASLLAYFRFAPPEGDDKASAGAEGSRHHVGSWTLLAARWSGGWPWYVLALVLFAAALLSKTVVASMPAVVLVIYWWKRGRIQATDVVPLVPFLLLGAGLGLFTVSLEVNHVGAKGLDFGFTPVDRVLIAGRALWFYAGKLVLPYPLVFFYPRWTIDRHAWWQYLFPLAAAATFVVLFLARGRIGRGPLAAALLFAGVLMPALGFFDVYPMRFSFVADHFQYHASIALIALVAAGAATWAARLKPDGRRFARLAAGAVLVVLAAMTMVQARVYHDLETLYTHVIEHNPGSWTAYLNLSLHMHGLGRREEAARLAKEALRIKPEEPRIQTNMGIIYARASEAAGYRPGPSELATGIDYYREALRLNPDYVEALDNLGTALVDANQPEEAIKYFQHSLEVRPNGPYALFRMGTTLGGLGQWNEAAEHFQKAIDCDPDYAEAHHALGVALIQLRRLDEAAGHLTTATQLKPRTAEFHADLGQTRFRQGDFRQAAAEYTRAVQLRPNYVDALNNLAASLIELKEADRAIPYLEQVLRLQPDHAVAKQNLKRALQATGQNRP